MKFDMFKKIIDELYDLGCLSVLITGGEPLLNPQFKNMYIYAKERGFLVSVNSNGSLISDEIIELFNAYKPYAIEISIYGYDKNSYLNFTHSDSFNSVSSNIAKLQANNINVKLKTVITNRNYQYIDKLIDFSNKINIPFRYDYIVFPNIFSVDSKNSERLDINEILKIIERDERSKEYFKNKLLDLSKSDDNRVFQCLGGEQNVYIDSNGYINMCIALVNDKYNINNISISDTIKQFRKFKQQLLFNKNDKCKDCSKKSICRYCPARFKLETGSYNKCPSWYCEITDLIINKYDTFLCDLNDKIVKKMFEILSENMSKLTRLQITDKDYMIWHNNIISNKDLKTIINYNGELHGYIQYMDLENENKICICEIEIAKKNQGDGKTFKKLMHEFLNEHNINKYNDYIVYLNINQNDKHLIDVFTHLGFEHTEKQKYSITLLQLIKEFNK